MTTDPSTVDFPRVCAVAVAMKTLFLAAEETRTCRNTNSAANGRTARSVRVPIGRSSKIPGRSDLCKSLVPVSGVAFGLAAVEVRRIKQGGNDLPVD
jgi:hypothetical protein